LRAVLKASLSLLVTFLDGHNVIANIFTAFYFTLLFTQEGTLLTFLPAETGFIADFFRADHLFGLLNSVSVGIIPGARVTRLGTVVETIFICTDDSIVDIFTVLSFDVTLLVTDTPLDGAILIWCFVFFIKLLNTHCWEASIFAALNSTKDGLVMVSAALDTIGLVILVAILLGPEFFACTI
jgi:hypothetical protein